MTPFRLSTRRATRTFARAVAQGLQPADLVVLTGPLGAGKTFFVRAVARHLGLEPDELVTSPTFALVRELPTTPPLVHADLYRLAEPSQVRELGLWSARADGGVLLVEWGEAFVEALGGDALTIAFARGELESERTVALSASGPRSSEALSAIVALGPIFR